MLGENLTREEKVDQSQLNSLRQDLEQDQPLLYKQLIKSCIRDNEENPRATSLDSFSSALFPHLDKDVRRIACRGLLRALYELKPNDAPRFRLHWFTRAVEGVWASLDKKTAGAADDPWRTVGKLYGSGDKLIDSSGNRILETLYCDCCGTLFFTGYGYAPQDQFHSNRLKLLNYSRNHPKLRDYPEDFLKI